ncbi:MAG: dihydrolipoamide acetyltransferase family protein [Candidatus Cyclobacteriaceae bacterium M3_2C_046]
MALIEIVLPSMGESIMEATVLGWLKEEGDKITAEDPLVEVATDKVDTEVPSPYAGILKEKLAQKGDVVAIGKPIAVIESDETNIDPDDLLDDTETKLSEPASEEIPIATAEVKPAIKTQQTTAPTRFYSPLVKNIARQENISPEELEQIPGTGKENRVTKNDMLAYVKQRKHKEAYPAYQNNFNHNHSPQPDIKPADEIIQMDRMRQMISERMVTSKKISAHVTSFMEADLTVLTNWREKIKDEFHKKEGQKITLTPIFIEAVIKALKDYPMVNVSVDGDKIIKKKAINIGMAVALPNGNLIVPVIHEADQLNLIGLVRKVNDLALRARQNQLKPEELTGGTYSITNIGTFGNLTGTPIILQPQVGIMAFGAIIKKPAVIETAQGDTIGIRKKMILAHSYDHRVIDGALGGIFVKRVSDYLEHFDDSRTL